MKYLRELFAEVIDVFGSMWKSTVAIIISGAVQEHFYHEAPWPLWKWCLYSFVAWVLGLVILCFWGDGNEQN